MKSAARRWPKTILALGWAATAGCVFDSSGISPSFHGNDLRGEVRPDQTAPPADSARDTSRADQRRDRPPAQDSGPRPPDSRTYKPVTAAEILAVWNQTQVQCIDDSGAWNGKYISILDDPTFLLFVDGSITLAGAPAETYTWVGTRPSVTLVFNLNSCGTEDPVNLNQWDNAGILIRGATLTADTLVLPPSTTTADLNLLYVTSTGTFWGSTDFVGSGDSGLAAYPQLVAVVAALEHGIFQAATK